MHGLQTESWPRRWLHRSTEPQRLFPLIGVALLTVIWGTTLTYIKAQRSAAARSAVVSTRELLGTYEAQVVRALEQIDDGLRTVSFWHDQGTRQSLAQLRDQELLPPDLLFVVSISDRDGKIVDSTRPQGRTDVSRFDYFEAQRQNAGFFVSTLQNDARSDAPALLHFSRRLSRADGSFDGVVVVSVEAAYFVSGYESGKLGHDGLIALLGADGVVQVRRSGETIATGGAIDPASVTQGADDNETPVSIAASGWDHVNRWTSSRQLYGFPLAVLVGLSVDEQFAAVQRSARIYLWLAAVASALSLLSLAVLGRLSWQLAQSRVREIEIRQAHAERVEYLAYHDGLTELPNRSLFSKLLVQSIGVARRYDRSLAVAFIDLDRFKPINDTLGHDAGDDLLQQVATRLKSCVRDSDTVARLGGDEFVVLLPQIESPGEAATVAEKILSAIARPFTLRGREVRITASIGIALCPGDGVDEETLKKNADTAMYRAKSEGKNNFQFYTRELDATSLERLSLETNLRHALEHDELRLHYQAKRDLATGRISGMEALLRWEHPELGIIAPMRFIPVAEETGLIIPIGKWVLQTACAQNVAWQEQLLPGLCVAVNLSARQFYDDNLLVDVRSVLAITGLAPWLLELEIPESALSNRADDTRRILAGLKTVGVRIAVADFGLGYASLSMLQDFAFDTIKIDRSLTGRLTENVANSELADAVIAMGRSLSVTVVAQGVETSDQADFLRAHACNELQGFYVGKPVAAEEFAASVLAQADGATVVSPPAQLYHAG